MNKEFTYIDGVTIAICRRVCKFAFNKERVLKVEANQEELTYDIYLKKYINGGEEVDPESIEYFNEFWGNRFRIFIISIEDEEENDSDSADTVADENVLS